MKTPLRSGLILAIVATSALALSACSSSGGKQDEGKGADTPRQTIALITHSAKGDTFWDIVREGAEAAAAKDNIELKYYSDPEGAGQAKLIRNAVDQKVDGIAVTLAKPDAVASAVEKATDAGIPVVGLNSGIDHWQDLGVLEYFGNDETIAGTAFGEQLNEVGAKKTLCVIHESGQVAQEARCKALKEEFKGKTEIQYVDGGNMPDVKSSLTSKLQSDKKIDFVSTLAAPIATTAVEAVADADSKAKVATFDTNKELVKAIKNGDIQWAIDQQPYLQGYLAVDGLWLYNTNGNTSGGGSQPVLTGPAIVDKSNVDDISKWAENGTR
ncbi:substrate-binding domain-containing protein [Stackebrandtia nassauensis]|uniref:Periplasmic binding protein/LacI transcriptional regulator n=1 Tax=Stackebrandtia nassauensis (strain DSM 44728 / CIP 108903 / NRRL B-16338 / NBRC 102104 / LLR-40K-21) TaxID=446470 RepID=D3Q6X0_STANL|nr:substrate-binding domain-containing protein [Stackebrandtia nassauensis]ADD40369.1 periplasmic binding protein/LacI transcriptional regulator [Stackebrandtia nassauensis DSM 44728]